MTSRGGRNGRERPRASRRTSNRPVAQAVTDEPSAASVPPAPPPPTQLTGQSEVGSGGPAQQVGVGQQAGAGPAQQAGSEPAQQAGAEPGQQAVAQPQVLPQASWRTGDPVCPAYERCECGFGLSGKTGGVCPNPHPKRCEKFLTWGPGGEKGEAGC